MHCPRCRTEYRSGFSACTDCGAALEAGPVPPNPEEGTPTSSGRPEGVDSVQVLHTRQLAEADMAAALLQAEGIPARSLRWYPGGLFGTSLDGPGWAGTCTVVVPGPFEQQARELLAGMGATPDSPLPPPAPEPTGPRPFGVPSSTLNQVVAVAALALVLLGVIALFLSLRG